MNVNVARKYHGAESVIFEHDGTESKYAVDDFSCYCDAGLDFQDSHRNEVKEVQEILLSLKRDVCREILIWFFGRTNAGNLLWSNEEVWWSNVAVNEAHNEYSDLYYPKSFSVCACHGIY